MPGADITKVLGVRLIEVRRVNPHLVKNTESSTKLVEIFSIVLERVGRV
jgi:hypothetical protein